MATYTSNYAWTKPGGNDQVDISVLNGNLDSQDTIMHKAFTNMAQAFSAASTYAVGDIVLYDNVLYKCHTAVTVAGAWTGSTNWQVYKLSEGGGGGTSNYNDLTNKPSINGVTLSGNKTTSDLGIDKTAVGLGNVPNVSTNDQEPTFTEASTRNNIASGEKLSVILGKVQKFFNDLKTVAFSGSYTDLSNKPENANTFQGTIAEWNQLSTAEKKAYDHASIPDSIDGGVTFPANKVVMTGGGNVENAVANIGNDTNLGYVQGSGTIALDDSVSNYRFIQILIGYYGSGYPCFGQALLPVSTLLITADDITTTVAFSDRNGTSSGKADISFLSATSVKVVSTSSVVYTRIVGIA